MLLIVTNMGWRQWEYAILFLWASTVLRTLCVNTLNTHLPANEVDSTTIPTLQLGELYSMELPRVSWWRHSCKGQTWMQSAKPVLFSSALCSFWAFPQCCPRAWAGCSQTPNDLEEAPSGSWSPPWPSPRCSPLAHCALALLSLLRAPGTFSGTKYSHSSAYNTSPTKLLVWLAPSLPLCQTLIITNTGLSASTLSREDQSLILHLSLAFLPCLLMTCNGCNGVIQSFCFSCRVEYSCEVLSERALFTVALTVPSSGRASAKTLLKKPSEFLVPGCPLSTTREPFLLVPTVESSVSWTNTPVWSAWWLGLMASGKQ